MKAVVNLLFFLLFSFTLSAQTYIADEFIVEYIPSATAADQQEVRALYNITDYALLSNGIELWQNITWPLTLTENEETVIINDVEELQ